MSESPMDAMKNAAQNAADKVEEIADEALEKVSGGTDFDQLRRENLDKDASKLDEIRRENLDKD